MAHEPLDALLLRTHKQLQSILARYRIPTQDAEDVLQDTLLLVVRKYETLENPEAYLVTSLRFRCLMYWRQRRGARLRPVATELLEDLAPPLPPQQDELTLRLDLEQVLEHLPPPARRLFRWRYAIGYSAREVAHHLDEAPDRIRQRSMAVRRKFRRGLERAEIGPPPDPQT